MYIMDMCLCVCAWVGAHLLMNAILRSVRREREIVQGSLGGRASWWGEEKERRGWRTRMWLQRRRQSRYAERERLKKNEIKTTNITNGLKFNIVPNTV